MKRIAVLAVMAAVLTTVTSGWMPAGAGPGQSIRPVAPMTLEAVPVKSGLALTSTLRLFA